VRRAALCPIHIRAQPCRSPPHLPALLTPAASPRSIVAPQETGDKVWAKAGNVGDGLVVQLLLKKQDSGLWRTKKLVVTTPEAASQAAAVAPARPPRVTFADEEMGNEMLLCARYGEFEDMVAILDENVVPVDYQNDGLNTALHYVSANGNLECIRELLRRGARSLANSSGITPLHWAVQNKQLDATKELLANLPGCDVLQKNDFGRSSLTEAFQTDNAQILEVVLGHSSAAALENPGGGVVEEETDEQVDEGAEGEGAPAGAAEDKMVIE
jgi:ankyrin repeat protein